jgi:hypothetical protein
LPFHIVTIFTVYITKLDNPAATTNSTTKRTLE